MGIRTAVHGLAAPLLALALVTPAAAVDYPIAIQRGNGLVNVFAKLNSGQTAKIAYIGGSVTQNPGWRDNVTAWFNSRYPGRITEINAGWSGTGSLIGAMRLARDVLSQSPDLIFVEFAINDLPADPRLFVERNCEGFPRQAWSLNPRVDMCFIETISHYIEASYLNGVYPTTVQAHYAVCDRYGLPSINVGWRLYQHVQAGTSWGSLTINGDRVHPNSTGSAIYSNEAVIPYLESERTRGGASRDHTLPPALTDFPVMGGTLLQMASLPNLSGAWSRQYNQFGAASFIQTTTSGATVTVGFVGPAAAAKVIVSGGGSAMSYSVDGGAYAPANIAVSGFDYIWTFPTAKMSSTGGTHSLTLRADAGTVRIIHVESANTGPPPPTTVVQAMKVAVSALNVRAGPGTSYAIVGQVKLGQVCVSDTGGNGWYRIWFNGTQGWCSGAYLTRVTGVTAVKVNAGALNVRSGPGTQYTILGTVSLGQMYGWIATSSGWENVWWGGRAAWVSGAYVTRIAL